MRKAMWTVLAAAVCLVASDATRREAAAQQGKYGLGVRANVGTPPNPNAAPGEAMIWGEAVWVNGQQFWGITAHGSLTLPNPPNPDQGASAYRVVVKDVYHGASDAHAIGYNGSLMKEGYWTGATEIWWSGTFLAAWSGVTPGFNLPYGGTYTVTFALEVTVPGFNWFEVTTCTAEFEW